MDEIRKILIEEGSPYWQVHREGGSLPTFKHLSLYEAKVEAARIAQKEVGHRVVITETRLVDACIAAPPVVSWEGDHL